MVNGANNSISELLLLSDSLYNANILGRSSAKKLLAFLPATTNPQEPNPRPHTFILIRCLLSGCRFCWTCSLFLPKSHPSSRAPLLLQLLGAIQCQASAGCTSLLLSHHVSQLPLPPPSLSFPPSHLQSLELILV